jgi:hypothetical protein
MWREGHCCNLLSDFEINTYKKLFTKYEYLLKVSICVCVCVWNVKE